MPTQTLSITKLGQNEPFELQVSRGQITNHEPLNIFAFSAALGSTAFGPLWEGLTTAGGSYVYPSSAVVMTLVSTSASDVGITVVVSGLDAGFNIITETVTLNGTTNVNTVKAFFRINRMYSLSGNAVGNVTCKNGGVTYAQMNAGVGSTQMSIFTVPAGYTFYQTYYQADSNNSSSGPNYVQLRTYEIDNLAGGTKVTRFQSAFVQQLQVPVQFPLQFTEKRDIQYQFLGSPSSGSTANLYVGGVLIKNDGTL